MNKINLRLYWRNPASIDTQMRKNTGIVWKIVLMTLLIRLFWSWHIFFVFFSLWSRLLCIANHGSGFMERLVYRYLNRNLEVENLYIDGYLEASLSNQATFGKGAPSKFKLKLKVTGGAILLLQPWSPKSGVWLTNENIDLVFWGKWYL